MMDRSTTYPVYELGEFRLDPRRRALSHLDGRPIAVTTKAFDALCHLVEHAGTLVPRSAFMQALWPDRIVEDNNLSQTISMLRRVLGDGYIVTVPGRGYQFVADVCVYTRPIFVEVNARGFDASSADSVIHIDSLFSKASSRFLS